MLSNDLTACTLGNGGDSIMLSPMIRLMLEMVLYVMGELRARVNLANIAGTDEQRREHGVRTT